MAEGRKVKSSGSNDIEVYWHKTDKRKNAVPVGLASYGTAKPKKYEYDPHLEFFSGTRSLPFKLGNEKSTAVKVIDLRGNEVMVVRVVG